METKLPFLEIQGPKGQEFTIELPGERLTIGRLPEFNDLALEPDQQQLITRIGHCSVERSAGGWWVVDNGSVNKTFVKIGEIVKVVDGRSSLSDGDVIRVLGQLTEIGDPKYWEITFRDPMSTFRVESTPSKLSLEYDWIQAKLFRVVGSIREEIPNVRPQEHKLIRYMDQRNRANGNVPVMCTYDELIEAIWGDEYYGHTENEINRLIWELRKKIELDQKNPQFLELVRRLGYRLVTQPMNE